MMYDVYDVLCMNTGGCFRVHEAMCIHHHRVEEFVRGLTSGQQPSRDDCTAHRDDAGARTCSGRCGPTHPARQVVERGREGGESTALLYVSHL